MRSFNSSVVTPSSFWSEDALVVFCLQLMLWEEFVLAYCCTVFLVKNNADFKTVIKKITHF